MLTRAQAIALVAAAPLLARCGSTSAIRVGSKNFTESFIIAEIYAQALEGAGMQVQRRFNLGSTQIALAAIQRGDIDVYPEYTGTALIDVLHLAPIQDPAQLYATVKREFDQRFNLLWFEPSPMNDSQALATTKAISKAQGLVTLSQVAKAAPKLRFATIQEFLSRPDGLPGLQKFYGGFQFANVTTYGILLKYAALTADKADIVSAFTTDGAIDTDALVVLQDDRHFWPPYNVAPVARKEMPASEVLVERVLNSVSPAITTQAARRMNAAVESGRQDPAAVAHAFLAGVHH